MRRGADRGGGGVAGGVRAAAGVAPAGGGGVRVARFGSGAVVPMDAPPPPGRAARAARDGGDRAGWTKLERLSFEVAEWRTELEVRLLAAMLRLPRVGLARADAAGLTGDMIDRPDCWRMYLAVRCCAAAGDGSIDDRTFVLAMARHVLRDGGYWDDAALATERGLTWSDASLVNLACAGEDGVEDAGLYAAQLVDLDRRVAEARGCWGRMVEVLEGVGTQG